MPFSSLNTRRGLALPMIKTIDFVKSCNRSIYLIDLCQNTFAKHINEKTEGKHQPAIYGLIANSHVYNITDKDLRTSITQRGIKNKVQNMIKAEAKQKMKDNDKREHKELPNVVDLALLEDNHIYYNSTNDDDNVENPLLKWMYEIIRVHRTVPKKIKFVGQTITSMTWKNITLWHNKHSKKCIAICFTLKMKYRNQSIQTLSKVVMEKLKINRVNLLSRYNHDVRKIFNASNEETMVRCGGLNYRPLNVERKDCPNMQAYDINKCYSYIASTYKLPVITIWDHVEPFSGKIEKSAFYYVENHNMLMQSYGWYIGHLVDHCLLEGLIAKKDIKFMIIPSNTCDEFRKLVSGVHSLGLGAYAKNIVNIAIGALAMKDSKTINSIYTTSLDEANYYRCMFNSNIVVSPAIQDNNCTLYRIDNKINSICLESGKPAYVSIVQIGYMLIHKVYKAILSQDIGAKLLNIHVDCVYVERSNIPKNADLNLTNALTKQKSKDNIGFIRRELKLPEKISELKMDKYNVQYKHCFNDYSDWKIEEIKQWNSLDAIEICKKYPEGLLVVGAAGCGKSEMLKAFKKHFLTKFREEQIMTVGFTNSCMNGNIQGRTLHNLFGIGIANSNEAATVSYKKHLIDDIKICLVDEISMVPGYMYSYLLLLKQLGVKLFIFGDFRQIPPIEAVKRDYENSIVLKQLCNSNKLKLTHNYRSDTKYVAVCDSGRFDFDYFVRNNDMSTLDKFNIARYNDVCSSVNDKCALIYGLKGCDGSRLIINRTIRKLNIYKNQFYEVINKETKTIKQLFVDNAVERVIDDWELLLSKSSLGYCCTVEKSQGLTVRENYTIYNFEKYEDNHKYVALTRTSNPNNVRIDGHKTGIIYKICKKKAKRADKIYIGSTACGLANRFNQHVNSMHNDSKLNRYMMENDCEAVRLSFVIYSDKAELLRIEDQYIKQFNTVDNGLNSRVNYETE